VSDGVIITNAFSSSDISGSTVNMMLKICLYVEYAGRLMPVLF